MRHYLIAADNRGEIVLCEGKASRLQALAARFRHEKFFRYVRVSPSPELRCEVSEPHHPHFTKLAGSSLPIEHNPNP